MIRFIYGKDLHKFPLLADTMFRDRAAQFTDRLAWDLSVDDNGWEKDQYDVPGALYCIYELPDGTHGGSGRLMPTTGPTMVNDHFTHVMGGGAIVSPLIWESTRFVASPRLSGGAQAARKISAALMLAGAEVGAKYGLEYYIGVFDRLRIRIWKGAGWAPEIIGQHGEGKDALYVGLWSIQDSVRQHVEALTEGQVALGEVPAPEVLPLAA